MMKMYKAFPALDELGTLFGQGCVVECRGAIAPVVALFLSLCASVWLLGLKCTNRQRKLRYFAITQQVPGGKLHLSLIEH